MKQEKKKKERIKVQTKRQTPKSTMGSLKKKRNQITKDLNPSQVV
jgi:hypothetical protein